MSADESKSVEEEEKKRIRGLAEKWISWDKEAETRKEIEELLKAEDWKQLSNHLSKRISFGTAGLRGRMCAGFANMNVLTVQQATQGLTEYLKETFGEGEVKKRGVMIGYDGRHRSLKFASITAAVLLHKGVRVRLFSDLVPTPFVAYGSFLEGCVAGIMVTASHNPKDDNGYKVYWDNACQIVSPVDKGIAAAIEEHAEPWPVQKEYDAVAGYKHELISDPLTSVADQYYAAIAKQYCYHADENSQCPVGFVFTPMHGVGNQWIERAFKCFNLPPFIPVKEQMDPDPDFSTVAFPNPEEGKGALKLAIDTADANDCPVIIANDPDSDRLAAAEKQADGWKIFSGNEIGLLLANWVWTKYKAANPDVEPGKVAVLNTTVSSKILQAMARKEGLYYEETLTGFKWLGTLGEKLSKELGMHFLFAFEEAIGFMIGDLCRDKDGVRAASVFAEMTGQLYKAGSSLQKQLDSLYDLYGYYETQNSYFFCHHPPTMFGIFDRIRPDGKYPGKCGDFAIRHIRDLQTGHDSSQPGGRAILPLGSSPMLTFYFENGAIVTMRGSGTEPKLKYYAELGGSDRQQVHSTLSAVVSSIITHFLQPEKNNLQPPSDD